MDRKDLIRMYLDAETTCEQERELAESFAAEAPTDEEEAAVCRMMQAIMPLRLPELPEVGDEYDLIVKPAQTRTLYARVFSLAGIAAAIAALVLLAVKTENPTVPDMPQNDPAELIRQIACISNFQPDEAESLEFKPVGDGFVMTVRFSDRTAASYVLIPLDEGKSFNLVALNN